MEFTKDINEKEYVIFLKGKAGNEDCQKVADLAREFMDSGHQTLIFDFTEMELLDSLGMSLILLAQNELNRESSKHFVLRNPIGKVKVMFENFNIDQIVDVKW